MAIQQPTAIARAADMMNPKYLMEGLTMNPRTMSRAIELAKEYCPIAKWKSMGFYETQIGKGLREMMFGGQSKLAAMTEKSMALAGKMDEITWGALWRACEKETKALHPELKGEALYEAAGRRLSEMIDYTQVVDTPLHRSQLMRSKNSGVQMATAFMSEPTKTWNMLQASISRFAENRRDPAARAKVGRTMLVFAFTAVLNAAAQSVMDAVRDDDEDETFGEKYMQAFIGDYSNAETAKDYLMEGLNANTFANLNPLGLLPYANDILSMIQGYDANRMDMQAISKIIDLAEQWEKVFTGENTWSEYKLTYKTVEVLSYMTGVPASNLMRDMAGIYNTVSMALGGKPIAMENETASLTFAAQNLYDAMLDGNAEKWERITGKLHSDADSPKDNSQIDAAIAKVLADEEAERLDELYRLKAAGKGAALTSKRSAWARELAKTGVIGTKRATELLDKALKVYESEQEPEDEKEFNPDKALKVRLYTTDDAVAAVRSLAGLQSGTASLADAKAIISELSSDSTAKDPAGSVKSSIQTELKKDYMAALKGGNTARMQRIETVLGQTVGTEKATITEWRTDYYYAAMKDNAAKYNVTGTKQMVGKLRAEGKKDSSIASSLTGMFKPLYIAGNATTRRQIENLLMSLGLKTDKGKDSYQEWTFENWLKNK